MPPAPASLRHCNQTKWMSILQCDLLPCGVTLWSSHHQDDHGKGWMPFVTGSPGLNSWQQAESSELDKEQWHCGYVTEGINLIPP